MEQQHNADVVRFPFQPIDTQKVVADFWEQNGEALRAAINDPEYIDDLYAYYVKTHPSLSKEQFAEKILYQHEVDFVEHILTRLCTILNGAQERYGFNNEGIAFNINTSLLYDVDETIGGRLRDKKTFRIRPVATLSFSYIRNYFGNVRLGVVSKREQKDLDNQLEDEHAIGSLTKIKPYINGEVIGIYAEGGGLFGGAIMNELAFDPRVYPDFQPVDDAMYVMRKMGIADGVAEDVLKNQLPVLIADAREYALLEFPGLWVNAKNKLNAFVNENRGVFPGYKSWTLQNPAAHTLRFELCKRTRVIAEYIDSHGDADPSELLEMLAREIAASPEFGLSQDNQNLFVPTVIGLLRDTYDVIIDIDGKVLASEQVVFPDEVTTKIEKLEFMAYALVSLYQKQGPVDVMLKFNYRNSEDPGGKLSRHVFNKGKHLLIENPGFAQNFNAVFSSISAENREHQQSFASSLDRMLGVADGSVSIEILQRISACLRQLDEGLASVVISVDNSELAEKFDELFQGKLVYEGKVVDPVAVFKMPESYRGRIFLMHVGAECSQEAIHERIERTLAA